MSYCWKTGKIVYLSRSEASETAVRMQRRRRAARSRLHIYKCSYCSRFHLSSKC